MDRLNWVQMQCSLKQVDVKQLYNPVLQEVRVGWRSEFGVSGCSSRSENQVPAEAGPSGPPIEQPRRTRKKCCYSQKTWGSICYSFVQPPTHLSHINLSQPFQIKWEVYFSKEVCPLVIIVLTMLLHAYEYITHWLI